MAEQCIDNKGNQGIDQKVHESLKRVRKGLEVIGPLSDPCKAQPHQLEVRAKLIDMIGGVCPQLKQDNYRNLNPIEQNKVFTQVISEFQKLNLIELGEVDAMLAEKTGKRSFALVDKKVGMRTLEVVDRRMLDARFALTLPASKGKS